MHVTGTGQCFGDERGDALVARARRELVEQVRCRGPGVAGTSSSIDSLTSAVRQLVAKPAADADHLAGWGILDHPRSADGRRLHHVDEVRRREVPERRHETGRSSASPGRTARTWRPAAGASLDCRTHHAARRPVGGGGASSPQAGLQVLDVLGGERLAADAPLAALHLFDRDPGDGAHRLALDVDHRLGELGDDLLLLVRREHTLDELDLHERHGCLLCRVAGDSGRPPACARALAGPGHACLAGPAACKGHAADWCRGFRVLGSVGIVDGDATPARSGAGSRGGCSGCCSPTATSVVSTDRLIDVLWDEPPDSARRDAAELRLAAAPLRRARRRRRRAR